MTLNKAFFERETNIKAEVLCDSVCLHTGKRITTFLCEFPRFILPEINTHKMISKNCSSSRAIPIKAMIENIKNNLAMPMYWGKNKSGMSAVEEVENKSIAEKLWKAYSNDALEDSLFLSQELGLHKQIANRITEPFQMVKMVMTATEWDNFFHLRIAKDAQPEICMLAYKIYKAMQDSTPFELEEGEWHLPYVGRYWDVVEGCLCYDVGGKTVSLEQAQRVSASCIAQTSYRKSDDSLEKADKIFDMLINAETIHASPFESMATPISPYKDIENKDFMSVGIVNSKSNIHSWQKGVTHLNNYGELCSGNLVGWVSYRHGVLPSTQTCYEFDFNKRMGQFV